MQDRSTLSIMATPPTSFPVAEGVGIFVGVVAWDLLADGHFAIAKALLIAVSCSLVWFGVRYWREKHPNGPR